MKRKYLLPLFLIVQIVLLKIIRFFPEQIERWYSNGFYILISDSLRISLGKVPFSLGDVLYALLIIWVIKWFWMLKKNKTIQRLTPRQKWKEVSLSIVSFLSVVYFLFHVLWGLNYYREPLYEKMKIEREYSDADLLDFTQKIIAKTNAIQLALTKDKNAKVVVPYSQSQLFQMNTNGYQNLAREHAIFRYNHLSIKKSLFSIPLTYMGFGGYLNPFTNEAQVNSLGPLYSFPMTANHEMAHQIGYASESECNFIGFLASIKNENAYIQYSGYSLALRYCLRSCGAKDEKIIKKLLPTLHPGILANFKESDTFWKQYDTFIDKGFHIFYDNFLKMNQQKEGMEGYSKYVDLMVNYFKHHAL
ncbi:MAG: DUF3810 domain-containing protein [Flavobacterium sp.]